MTAAFARRSPAAVAAALGTVYLVWGSTYLAIRVADRRMPPFLMSSARFLIAGVALYAFAARGSARPTARQWAAAAIVGAALLLIGNGGVAWAETRLESGLTALLVAMIPLWIALLDRLFFGQDLDRVHQVVDLHDRQVVVLDRAPQLPMRYSTSNMGLRSPSANGTASGPSARRAASWSISGR